MTIEQAIGIIHPDTAPYVLAEIEYYAGFNGIEASNKALDKARLMAVEALEKQMPKKPFPKKFRSIEYPQCPVCNRVLFASEKYCATCGQAIDRGE